MPKKESETELSEDEIQCQIALSRRNSIYARIQSIYECSKRAEVDANERESFLCKCINLDNLRNDFQDANNRHISFNLKLNPNANLDDQAWTSFEDLFCRIKYQYTKMTSSESLSKTP